MDETALRLGIHELIGDYAERIDEDRLEEWPDLFTDPCRYLVISRANHEAGMRQGVRRNAGPQMSTAATTLPRASWTGAATALSPSSYSPRAVP